VAARKTAAGKHSRQCVDLAVAIRMVFVRRFEGQTEANSCNDGRENVARRFDSIGDQRIGISENAGADLDDHQRNVDGDCEDAEVECVGG
jgi:hypothetical protein